ncbi:YtzI protein [Ornithinibacillus halophilus]|uniref:Tumour necrosis factor receptor superfamily member 19 n=1 Tax=Ornithinibacillus halophilus TaxID=930117 RepID=A0A1M5GZM8_9BACI|nr:YtzI protein [Ornithinibacillus halophilus]SHG09127.1 Tumour necrosis factor receptor superfamily member 19 [Ornithinibacillus halophilus]
MIWYIVIAIVIIIAVLLLSLMTINKGYAYKHTIDPLPSEENETENNEEEK